ncbi:MAG TPA: hypothetical protein P5323_04415 [Candidatus Moranbacteria bacterium]|nr:hypothetical protein [Candidatus Moranbacteria bacterium]HRY28350.1 hypothetical protein [Candidatus Moranbacteria bacterium]HSA08396.1 hypothetical protein [Candidatus Moranbacteria bacterium]
MIEDNIQPLLPQKGLKAKLKSFFSQEFFASGLVHWVFIGSFILNAVNWGLIAFFIRPVDFPIILHYNVYFGVDVIGDWWQIYYLPIIGLVILAANTLLGYLFYQQKERIVAHLLMLATFIVQIAILVAVACLLMINY